MIYQVFAIILTTSLLTSIEGCTTRKTVSAEDSADQAILEDVAKGQVALFNGAKFRCSGLRTEQDTVVVPASCIATCIKGGWLVPSYNTQFTALEDLRIADTGPRIAPYGFSNDLAKVTKIKAPGYDACAAEKSGILAELLYEPTATMPKDNPFAGLKRQDRELKPLKGKPLYVSGWASSTRAVHCDLNVNRITLDLDGYCPERGNRSTFCIKYPGGAFPVCTADLGSPVLLVDEGKKITTLGLVDKLMGPKVCIEADTKMLVAPEFPE